MVQCSVGGCSRTGTHNGRCNSHKHRHARYGLTDDEMETFDAGIVCSLCPAIATVVDHCHVSGLVRGYLCNQCNLGLGNFKDNVVTLEKAIRYLRRAEYKYGERAGQAAA